MTAAQTSPQVLYVDFNDTDSRRRVIVLRGGENRRVEVDRGDLVELRDEDGYHVQGIVAKVSPKEIIVAPDWGTWWKPDSVRLKPVGESTNDIVIVLLDVARTAGMQTLVSK